MHSEKKSQAKGKMPTGVYKNKNRTNWTPEMISFLKNNYRTMTNRQLANELGLSLTVTRYKLYELDLKKMEMEYWSPEQLNVLISKYKVWGDVEIAAYLQKHFPKNKLWTEKHIRKKRLYLNLNRSAADIANIKKRNIEINKCGAKANAKRWAKCRLKIGTIALVHIREWPMYLIKIGKGGNINKYWKQLSHYNYEKYIGKIRKGNVIIFKDGNSLNCDPQNLEQTTRSELAKRNWQRAHLTDNLISSYLAYRDPQLRKEILTNHKYLIEIKRTQLKLNRELKNAS